MTTWHSAAALHVAAAAAAAADSAAEATLPLWKLSLLA